MNFFFASLLPLVSLEFSWVKWLTYTPWRKPATSSTYRAGGLYLTKAITKGNQDKWGDDISVVQQKISEQNLARCWRISLPIPAPKSAFVCQQTRWPLTAWWLVGRCASVCAHRALSRWFAIHYSTLATVWPPHPDAGSAVRHQTSQLIWSVTDRRDQPATPPPPPLDHHRHVATWTRRSKSILFNRCVSCPLGGTCPTNVIVLTCVFASSELPSILNAVRFTARRTLISKTLLPWPLHWLPLICLEHY